MDRVSLVVDGRAIKRSDIVRDIRLTEFLNHQPLSLELGEQKQAAKRLIDQTVIRKELEAGLPVEPDAKDVEALHDQIAKSAGSDGGYSRTLSAYGISDQELRAHLTWQLTVLRFINMRFAQGFEVPETDIRAYYNQHLAEFRRAGKPKLDLDSLRPDIEQTIRGERVNQQFFSWLDEAEKNTPIIYNEQVLK